MYNNTFKVIKFKRGGIAMNNIYDTLPLNFFNLFNNASNKQVMSDCLFVLYNYIKNDASFAAPKENIIFELSQYFATHIVNFGDIECVQPKDRALYVYKRLRECGWINESIEENYQIYASFEDYAMIIIEALLGLDKERDVEYSSMVYNIYSAFANFDVMNGHKILDAQYAMTKDLITKLKNLNTNIKRYIKKLLKDNMKNNLNELLNSLLSEYQLKIVDRAFYTLTTRDHPLKYRNSIISQIHSLRMDDDAVDTIVRNYMVNKEITYEAASDLFMEQTDYIIDAFENILDLINEISKKNERFVSSATNRIMFLISVKEDISGKINNIIKASQKNEDLLDDVGAFSMNKILDSDSLYTTRRVNKKFEVEEINLIELDEQTKKKALEVLKHGKKHTKNAIEACVLSSLETNTEILGSQFLEEQDDISTLILAWLYGYSKKAKYEIEPMDYSIKKNNYQFREFIIREVK